MPLNKTLPTDNEIEFATTALLAALQAHHAQTAGQQTRVSDLALAIGRAMNLRINQLFDLKFGSLLHDIGKLAVSPALLAKTERLNADDWTDIRRHPTTGATMLRRLNYPAGVCQIVEEHHEFFNGAGYPFQKAGQTISLGARIVAVADSYDAITKDREYRKGQPHNAALNEISCWAERQFDPDVVAVLLAIRPPELTGQTRGTPWYPAAAEMLRYCFTAPKDPFC